MKIANINKLSTISFTSGVVPVPDPKPTVLTDQPVTNNDETKKSFFKKNCGKKLDVLA